MSNNIRPYLLAESNWKTIKDSEYSVVILPWGATEAHNYHLPYATDNIQAEHIAAEAARIAWESGKQTIVLPGIPYGVNTGQHDIKLDINMNPSTQHQILDDIIASVDRAGIEKFIILNGHGGNDFKQIIRELQLKYRDMFLCMINWFRMEEVHEVFENPGDHAGEMETSLVMHLSPHLVLSLEHAGDGSARSFIPAALNKQWAWAEREWSKVTDDTGVGDPKNATPEKGKRIFELVSGAIANFLIELADTDIDNLYE